MNPDIEFSQGKNVTDVSKAIGVSHLIFSSLHHVTEETKGRLSHVPHFDSKASIEKYIRASGVGCSFVLPGYYMSNFTQMLSRAEDGSYQLFYPVGKQAQFPLFDAAQDTGETSPSSPLFFLYALTHISPRSLRESCHKARWPAEGQADIGRCEVLHPRGDRGHLLQGDWQEGCLRPSLFRSIQGLPSCCYR